LSCVDAGKKGTKRGSPVVFLVPGSGAAVAVWVAVSRASPEQRPFESCLRGGGWRSRILGSRRGLWWRRLRCQFTPPESYPRGGAARQSWRWSVTSGSVSREIERGVSRARVERDREGRGSCFFEQLGLGYVSPPTFHIGLIKSQPTSLLAPPLLIFSLPCLLSCSFPSRTSTLFIFVQPPFLISAPPLICVLLLYFFFLCTPLIC